MPRSESARENGLSQTRHLMKRINHLAKSVCLSRVCYSRLEYHASCPKIWNKCADKQTARRPLITPELQSVQTHLISSFSPATASSTADMQSPVERHPANPAEGATKPFVRDAARRDSVAVSTDARRVMVGVVAFFVLKKVR